MSELSLQPSFASELARFGVSAVAAETPKGVSELLSHREEVVAVDLTLPAQSAEMVSLLSAEGLRLAAVKPTKTGCRIYAFTGEFPSDDLRQQGRGAIISDDGLIRSDTLRQAIVHGGRTIPLSCVEWEILCCLAESPFRIWSREELVEAIPRGQSACPPDRRTIDAHIKNLRRKLEEDSHRPRHLLTARSRGYYLQGFRRS